jgi:Oligoendopeptidase F
MKRTIMKRHSVKSSSHLARAKDLSDHWDLTHLLSQPQEEFEHSIKRLDSQVSKFESLRGSLSPDMSSKAFLDILRLNEAISTESAKVSAYAYLWFSENTKNLEARAFKTKVEERLTALQNRMLFFDLWWQTVDEANAARLMESSGDVQYFLESIRRYKPHTLSEAEEKIINVKNTTGRHAVNTIYDVLTNGLMFTLTVKGQCKTLTREQLSMYIRSSEPKIREAAYREMYRVFASHHDVLGEIYTTLVNDWKSENIELRKFAAPIAARNLGNDVPDEAVDALLNACAKNCVHLSGLLPHQSEDLQDSPNEPLSSLCAPPDRAETIPLSRRRAHGAGSLSILFTATGRTGQAGVARTSRRCSNHPGETRRSLLL